MLGTYISELCKKEGTCVYQLEKDLGIGNGTIKRWDNSAPNLSTLVKVADHFHLDLRDLCKMLPEKRT